LPAFTLAPWDTSLCTEEVLYIYADSESNIRNTGPNHIWRIVLGAGKCVLGADSVHYI